MKKGMKLAVLVLFCVLLPAAAFALDSFFASPRAMGMGGAQVVSVKDATAQYYNPAAFGFFGMQDVVNKKLPVDRQGLGDNDFGLDLGFSLGYRLHGEFGKYIDDLADIDLDAVQSNTFSTESDLQNFVTLMGALTGIDQPGTGVTFDSNVGLSLHVGSLAVGARGYTQVSSLVLDLDNTNLGLAVDAVQLSADAAAVTPDGFVGGVDYEFVLFTAEQQAQLSAAELSEDLIQKLDYVAAEYGIPASQVADVVTLIDNAVDPAASDLADNTTTVAMTGFGYVEVPISYGYAFSENLAIGANFKAMQGRVYANQVLVFDNDSGDLLDASDELYQETDTFGIDLGVMARYENFSFGLMGRNLNSPEFDGFSTGVLVGTETVTVTADDMKLDPQLTAGVAFMPFDSLLMEVNCDLSENDTSLPGYATRNLSVGVEWNPIGILALRAGAYKNLAEDDIDMVYTAGLGLNLAMVQFDIAGTYSPDSYEFDGSDLPQESRVAAELSIAF